MSREVRRVPPDWDHWSYSDQPLHDNFKFKNLHPVHALKNSVNHDDTK